MSAENSSKEAATKNTVDKPAKKSKIGKRSSDTFRRSARIAGKLAEVLSEKETVAKKPKKKEPAKPRTKKSSEMEDTGGAEWENAKSVYDFTVRNIKGEEVSLEKYKGFVLLVVNVASKCGLTSTNYAQLVQLDEKFRDKGLRILAFPCNQFGGQEPGTPDEICEFTKRKNVTFDLFEKINVNGKNTHPLYKYLKKQQGGTLGDFIKWNFTKFIINKEGQPVERHPPTTEPETLIPSIEKYL